MKLKPSVSGTKMKWYIEVKANCSLDRSTSSDEIIADLLRWTGSGRHFRGRKRRRRRLQASVPCAYPDRRSSTTTRRSRRACRRESRRSRQQEVTGSGRGASSLWFSLDGSAFRGLTDKGILMEKLRASTDVNKDG